MKPSCTALRTKLETLQKSYNDLLRSCGIPKEQLCEQLSEKSMRVQSVNVELEMERDELRSMCEAFRSEAESILRDYLEIAQQLKASQEETAHWTSKHQMAMNELDWWRERVGLLEEQCRKVEEKSHMDQQVSIDMDHLMG